MERRRFVIFNMITVVLIAYSYHQMMELMYNTLASIVFILSLILWVMTIDYIGMGDDKLKCKKCGKEVSWLSAISGRCRGCI